jgi:hypothetical protein
MLFSPYLELRHDYVSRLCQAQIFFALLAGIVLKANPDGKQIETFGLILTYICMVPPLCIAFLVSPYSKYLMVEEHRAKAFGMLAKGYKAMRKMMRRCCGAAIAKSTPTAKVSPAATSSTGGGGKEGPPLRSASGNITRAPSGKLTMRAPSGKITVPPPRPPAELSRRASSFSRTRRDPTTDVCQTCNGWTGRADGKAPLCANPSCPGSRTMRIGRPTDDHDGNHDDEPDGPSSPNRKVAWDAPEPTDVGAVSSVVN